MLSVVPASRPAAPIDELLEALRWLRPAYREIYVAVERALEPLDVSVPLRGLLDALHRLQPATTPQLTRELRVPRQFVRRVVNEARDRKLLVDRPNPDHRTSPHHVLTDLGARTIAEIRQREATVLQGLHLEIDADDAERCAHVLRNLTVAFARLNATTRETG